MDITTCAPAGIPRVLAAAEEDPDAWPSGARCVEWRWCPHCLLYKSTLVVLPDFVGCLACMPCFEPVVGRGYW